jgi:hypothetical protein
MKLSYLACSDTSILHYCLLWHPRPDLPERPAPTGERGKTECGKSIVRGLDTDDNDDDSMHWQWALVMSESEDVE